MTRGLIILAVAAVVFWAFSAVDCIVQPATRHRGVSKKAWIAIVVLLPVIGGILWFVIGRSRGKRDAQRSQAPDDDPTFLGSIGSIADRDERIRRIEAELADLDSEDFTDDPSLRQRAADSATDDSHENGSEPQNPHGTRG